jgi:hypothetical protein
MLQGVSIPQENASIEGISKQKSFTHSTFLLFHFVWIPTTSDTKMAMINESESTIDTSDVEGGYNSEDERFSDFELHPPSQSSSIRLRSIAEGYKQIGRPRKPDEPWWWEIWKGGKRVDRKGELHWVIN